MTSKRNQAGLAALGASGFLAFIGAVAGWTWLTVLGLAGMLGVLGVIALNTNTLLRSFRTAYDRGARNGGGAVLTSGPVGATATQDDLTGALRLLQAQYVGRLDRAQTTLERAAEALAANTPSANAASGGRTGAASAPRSAQHGGALAGLPVGSVLVLHAVTDNALEQAQHAHAAGIPITVVAPDSSEREALVAAGLGEIVTIAESAPASAMTVALPALGG